MASPAFQGTPCLVPVQLVFPDGSERRGFITRLSPLAAAVSSDPGLGVAERVVLRFKRPADGLGIDCAGQVSALLPEGGLWRGRAAALVEFNAPAELDEGDASEGMSDAMVPSSPADGDEGWGEGRALTDSLRSAGLGRRKLVGRVRAPANPFAAHGSTTPGEPPPRGAQVHSGSPPAQRSERDIEASFFEDEPTAPPTRRGEEVDEDDATTPRGTSGPTSIGFGALFAFDDATVPPGGQTDPKLPRDGFAQQFSDLASVPAYSLPPGKEDDEGAFPGDLPSELPDDAISPTTAPSAPRPRSPLPPVESTAPAPHRPPAFARFAESSEVPPVQAPRNRQAAPPAASGRPPWEGMNEDRAALSLIPRNARIASTLDVHFWARGRRHDAIADNFSREGLFLTFASTPPVRGAIVRVEFPLEGEGESVPVRFNAEVRWHRSDRPGVGLADGFGVQILTFETPKDRARYGELLAAILALGPAPDPVEAGFSWGKQGGR